MRKEVFTVRRDRSGTFVNIIRPRLIDGMASMLDFFGLLRHVKTDGDARVTDTRAIAADWRAVGQDLSSAIESHPGG